MGCGASSKYQTNYETKTVASADSSEAWLNKLSRTSDELSDIDARINMISEKVKAATCGFCGTIETELAQVEMQVKEIEQREADVLSAHEAEAEGDDDGSPVALKLLAQRALLQRFHGLRAKIDQIFNDINQKEQGALEFGGVKGDRFAYVSKLGIRKLDKTKEELTQIESHVHQIQEAAVGTPGDFCVQLEVELAELEARARHLERSNVDDAYVKAVENNRQYQERAQKELLPRFEKLYREIKDIEATLANKKPFKPSPQAFIEAEVDGKQLVAIADLDRKMRGGVAILDAQRHGGLALVDRERHGQLQLTDQSKNDVVAVVRESKFGDLAELTEFRKDLREDNRRFSKHSEQSLSVLHNTNDELVQIERRMGEIADAVRGVRAGFTGKLEKELEALELRAKQLERRGVDGVLTWELNTGRQIAKETKKDILQRIEALYPRVEAIFAEMRAQGTYPSPRGQQALSRTDERKRPGADRWRAGAVPGGNDAGDDAAPGGFSPRLKRALSKGSEDTLNKMTKTNKDLAVLEKRVRDIGDTVSNGVQHNESGPLRYELTQLKARAKQLERKGVIDLKTWNLNSGKQLANETKSDLQHRFELLYSLCDEILLEIKIHHG